MCLCFSPVGPQFAKRAQQFPGLINGTTIDWFLPWPEEALISVAEKFLDDFPMVCSPEVGTKNDITVQYSMSKGAALSAYPNSQFAVMQISLAVSYLPADFLHDAKLMQRAVSSLQAGMLHLSPKLRLSSAQCPQPQFGHEHQMSQGFGMRGIKLWHC